MPSDAEINFSPDTPPRYVIGIDLGTTNSAVCFIDTQSVNDRIATFAVPQVVAPHQIEALETLPSFLYQASRGEFAAGALDLPWDAEPTETVVGRFAREQGKLVPGRVVESAKSWLCHPGVDRTSRLLPWQGAEDVERLSPVAVSAAYLKQIRDAWNASHALEPLERQDVVVTLPASFDEVARELTIEAAKAAGIPRLLLIEEPQAAFYAWIDAHPETWNSAVTPGQNILVCDVGGGTSDFTLIRVRRGRQPGRGVVPPTEPVDTESEEEVQFHRVAVGEHLILGGDNLDLALAHHLEQKLAGDGQFEPRQWGTLLRICRHVKEVLLGEDAPASYAVTVPGTGSRLIGGGRQVDVSREEARQLLLEGFFPRVSLDEKPSRKRSGFQEFGLPYAPDPAITRYLAAFLSEHLGNGASRDEKRDHSCRPDVLLFNGGVFVSAILRERVMACLRDWFSQGDPEWAPLVLANERHDLAVARGAAYYGMVRRGVGVRIAAGLPRTYYIGIGTDDEQGTIRLQAMALMPAGAEPGQEVVLDQQTFHLTIAAPVQFQLFYSSTRLTDAAGTLIPVEREQLTALPPIRTVLKSRKHKESVTIPVRLHARLTELGTLDVWCSEIAGVTEGNEDLPEPHAGEYPERATRGGRTWQLQFDVRSATQTDVAAHTGSGEAAGVLDRETIESCRRVLLESFGPQATEKPAGLPKRLSREMQMSREQWPPSLLREMWEILMDCEPARARSAEHEARWLNLLGYSLRPGFGVALDDWRVSETWKLLRGKLHHPGPACIAEWWILWRRISGGLPAGQQQALAFPLLTTLRDERRKASRRDPAKKAGRRSGPSQNQSESWRMLGALERLPVQTKVELGDIALETLDDRNQATLQSPGLWSLSRIGARQPFYGPLNEVVSPEIVAGWLERLTGQATRGAGQDAPPSRTQHSPVFHPLLAERQLAVMQLARRTGDRYRDLPEPTRQRVVNWLTATGAPEHYVTLVETGGELEDRETSLVFGESLPVGLRLHG